MNTTDNRKSMETVLLMLSGGLDSTYMLYHYLTQTNLRVHAHHISIRYPHLQRWRAEDSAVTRIVAFCRERYRDVEYSESYFGFDFKQHVGWDSDLQLLVASKVVPNLNAERITVAIGWCVEDLERPEVAERAQRQVTPNLWRALHASISFRESINPELAMPLVGRGVTKVDILRQLPRELLDLCWSCRNPAIQAEKKPAPCGQCHACLLNLTSIAKAGLNPADFPNLVRIES